MKNIIRSSQGNDHQDPLEIRRFLTEEDGAGVVEVILILVVIIGLVLIFKDQLTKLVNTLFKSINKKANSL